MSLSTVQYLGGFIQRLVYLFADQENGTRGFLTLLSSTTRQGNGTRRAFSRSPALGSLGTARWDHHGDRRPHTFIPRDVSPWSNAAPSSLSRKPHTQLSYTTDRSFHPGPEGCRIELGRIYPRRSPKEPTLIFGRWDARKRRGTTLPFLRLRLPAFSVFSKFYANKYYT